MTISVFCSDKVDRCDLTDFEEDFRGAILTCSCMWILAMSTATGGADATEEAGGDVVPSRQLRATIGGVTVPSGSGCHAERVINEGEAV